MKNFKCPKCSGKLYIDPGYKDEAYCITCGYAEYIDTNKKRRVPNPFENALEYKAV